MGRVKPGKVGLESENLKKPVFFGNYLLLIRLNFENVYIDISIPGLYVVEYELKINKIIA